MRACCLSSPPPCSRRQDGGRAGGTQARRCHSALCLGLRAAVCARLAERWGKGRCSASPHLRPRCVHPPASHGPLSAQPARMAMQGLMCPHVRMLACLLESARCMLVCVCVTYEGAVVSWAAHQVQVQQGSGMRHRRRQPQRGKAPPPCSLHPERRQPVNTTPSHQASPSPCPIAIAMPKHPQ